MVESRYKDAVTQTGAQNALLDYWSSLCEGDDLPKRSAFDPGAVIRYLGQITVLEASEGGELTCRLESTAMKTRVPYLDVQSNPKLGLDAILEKRCPVMGTEPTQHGAHHWLRLPLLSNCGKRLVILCHDEFIIERHKLASNPTCATHLSSHIAEVAA